MKLLTSYIPNTYKIILSFLYCLYDVAVAGCCTEDNTLNISVKALILL